MISRVAETCFWLNRHVERVENTARLLQVNLSFVLDVKLPVREQWRPFIIVSGEEKLFVELLGADAAEDGDAVQHYLTWDERSPVSIKSALYWARENARTIRETISSDMWETINGLWLWIKGKDAPRLYRRDRHSFYARVKEGCLLFHGVCHHTMLHEEPFDFMRLGMQLERAQQTARILDVKHHTLGPTIGEVESPAETAQWLSVLRSCSAREPFFKRSGNALTGPAVASFLLLDVAFPRAVLHGIDRASNFLRRIRPAEAPEVGERSAAVLGEVLASLKASTIEAVLEKGMHEELTRIIDAITAVCGAVHEDYFDPAVPEPANAGS